MLPHRRNLEQFLQYFKQKNFTLVIDDCESFTELEFHDSMPKMSTQSNKQCSRYVFSKEIECLEK